MAAPRLFERRWRVEVTRSSGGATETTLDVSELDLAFDVRLDLTRKPNIGSVEIWNLSPEHRASLAEALASDGGGVSMRISAGYAEPGISQIFAGEATSLSTTRESHDVITRIDGKDGRSVIRGARISQSFAPGTTVEAVVRAVVRAMGIGEGNLASYVTGLSIDGDRVFRHGYAVSDTAANALTELLRPAGLRWSIQAGALQVRRAGFGLDERAIKLSPESGLVGTPQPAEKGELNVTALIQPGLVPGQRIVLESADYAGGYVIREAIFIGNTRGRDWYAHLLLRPL